MADSSGDGPPDRGERLGGDGDGPLADVGADLRSGLAGLTQSYILLIVIGLLVGLQVAPLAGSLVERDEEPQPQVAVISLAGGINGESAQAIAAQVEAARANPTVEAIVLRVNSPGGGAAPSEELYLTVARAAAEMPVVVSVNAMAASGAYYTAVAADYIFAKPSSLLGSVGVVFVAPEGAPPQERLVVTGPYKETGGDLQGWQFKIDAAKQAFVGAVMAQRGDRLSISREEISTAKMFSGARSVAVGIADEVGGLQAAIAEAAGRADLGSYTVVTRSLENATFVTRAAYTASPLADKRLTGPEYFVGNGTAAAGPNILLLAPSIAVQAFEDRAVTAQNASAAGEANASATLVRPVGGGGHA
jgi:protease-4